MIASYPVPVAGVNTGSVDWSSLSASCVSFCRWVYRWYQQTGDVSPSTAYLARKQGKNRRTVYRWLSAAEAAGALSREVVAGVERSIIPLAVPPPASRSNPKCHRSCHRSHGKNVTGPSSNDAYTQVTQHTSGCVESPSSVLGESEGFPQSQGATSARSSAENPPHRVLGKELAESLASVGVSEPVAVKLSEELPEESLLQLAALSYRSPRDKAAVLVASIKQRWPMPAAFLTAADLKKKQAAKAQNDALRAELAKKRETTRSDTKARFSGLPEPLRAEYLDRAASLLRSELPDAYAFMQNRPPDVRTAWLTSRAISLMEGGQ